MKTRAKLPAVESAVLRVRVTPRSAKDAVEAFAGEVLRVRLKAPPVEGKANRALVDVLAERLDVARGAIEIVTGESARLKTLRIVGLSDAELRRRLTS